MPVTGLGESEASSRYYSFGTGSCSPTLRTVNPWSQKLTDPGPSWALGYVPGSACTGLLCYVGVYMYIGVWDCSFGR